VTLNNSLLKAREDMETYQRETTSLVAKLERADKLISGLASTKEGWIARRKELQGKLEVLVGDALMSAAFLSYCGPFPSEYREIFVTQSMQQVKQLKIPYSKDWTFAEFLVKPVEFLKWGFQGLPDD
jgi:dynein heavy chain